MMGPVLKHVGFFLLILALQLEKSFWLMFDSHNIRSESLTRI